MFYTFLLLGKRGILSNIWIAAHWEKKLTKAHIFECNLDSAVQSIMAPKVMIALRTSGHLLLGVVRIYNRKAKYLLADCNEAIVKMKMSFRPGALDLAEDDQEASLNAITLPEEFHEFDSQLPDLNLIDVVEHFTLNQSRAEDITIKEDYGRQLNNSFGDYLDPVRQDTSNEDTIDVSTSSFLPVQTQNGENRDLFMHDCFGDEGENTDFFDNQLFVGSTDACVDINKEVPFPTSPSSEESHLEDRVLGDDLQEIGLESLQDGNHTNLLSNENDGFVLEPIDVSAIEKRKPGKKRRKLMVDEVKEIPSSKMRQQIIDFSDTLTSVDIASAMEKNTGDVQHLLSSPMQTIINDDLLMLFKQCQKLDTSNRAQQEPTEPEIDILRKAPEELDLPPLEMTELTDVSSSYTEEPSNIHEMMTDNLTTTNVSISVQEESADPLWCDPSLSEEEIGQIENDGNEHMWNQRTCQMFAGLQKLNQAGVNIFNFQKLCKNKKRKEVSAKFYSFLVLKKHSVIKMTQSAPYCDIVASPGPKFHNMPNSAVITDYS